MLFWPGTRGQRRECVHPHYFITPQVPGKRWSTSSRADSQPCDHSLPEMSSRLMPVHPTSQFASLNAGSLRLPRVSYPLLFPYIHYSDFFSCPSSALSLMLSTRPCGARGLIATKCVCLQFFFKHPIHFSFSLSLSFFVFLSD